MNLQYITNSQGKKSGVLLSLSDWGKIEKDMAELQKLKNKKMFLVELKEAYEEMKLITQGKIEARNAEDFINEL